MHPRSDFDKWMRRVGLNSDPEPVRNLAGLFTAEKAWFGEYDPYVTDLFSVNWEPWGPGQRYLYGFCRPFPPEGPARDYLSTLVKSFDPTRMNTADPRVLAVGGYSNEQSFDPCAELAKIGLADEFAQTPQGTFKAFAVRLHGSELEVWSIDNRKRILRER